MNGRTTAAALVPVAPGPDVRLHTLVERHAAATPDALAVTCGDQRLAYADLDARANRLAHHLRRLGVGAEVPVAIRLPRGVDQVVAMVAVWKAGGCYVPLDDEHPADRVAGLLTQLVRTSTALRPARPTAPGAGADRGEAVAGVVLVTRGRERVAAGRAAGVDTVVCLDGDAAAIAAEPAEPAVAPVALDGLAAIIHTSGSTGTPKAVALTHRNVLSAQVGRDDFPAQPQRLLLPVSFAFDVFLSFAVWALRVGGEVVVPVQPRGADLDELATLLTSLRVTHLVAPPDLQRALLARADVREANSLVVGVVGGQSCPRTLVEDYRRSTAGARLVNEYALTETSAGTHFVTEPPAATSGHLGDAVDAAATPGPATVSAASGPGGRSAGGAGQVPIGRAAAGCRVHLLDEDLRPVAQGVTAEVFIGGPGIARGYLGRPGLTAERFVADPFGEPGERLYRTGDLARMRADGTLDFQGRHDRQVKIRGYRIELAEIEAALATHDGVGSGAVCHLPDREELVAYVVARAGAPVPSGEDLLLHLKRLLPEPMVPSSVVMLDVMPLTPHGKIDRAALADLGAAATEPQATVTGPRTTVEATIARVWADVLELDAVDVHADFFTIGGHSLLAASVLSRLRKEFTVTIALRDLFSATTVAALAELVTARGEPTDQAGAPAVPVEAATADEIVPTAAGGPVPLTAGQLQVWLVDRLRGGSSAYQVPVAVRLTGALDVDALRHAVDTVVARHEILRSRVEVVDGEPMHVVSAPRPVDLPVVEVTTPELAPTLHAIAAPPFDLGRDLPVRPALVRVSAEEHVLLLVLHHMAGDGESARVLLAEIAELYTARTTGREPALTPPPLQYRDYAHWYSSRVDGPVQRAQLDHWRERLAGIAELRLPVERTPGAVADERGATIGLRLGDDVTAAVRAVAAANNATPYMVLLAAFGVLLHRVGAGDDVAVGTPVSGRGRDELRDLVGYFGNTIVLRMRLSPTLSFADALAHVRSVTLDGVANQEVSFARVVQEVAPARDVSGMPLFTGMFSYDTSLAALPRIGDLAASEVSVPMGTSQFEFSLRLAAHPDGAITGELEYATALFDDAVMRRLCRQYEQVLTEVLRDPGVRIGSVSLLTGADAAAITAWNDTAAPLPQVTLPVATAAAIARTPDAPAVWADGRWLTYREFGLRVSRFAARLRDAGASRGDVVAVCLPRSLDLLVAVHAVGWAGCAYLPISPDLPAARIAAMIEDAGPTLAVAATPAHVPGLPHLPPPSAFPTDVPGHTTAGPAVGHAPGQASTGRDAAGQPVPGRLASDRLGVPQGTAVVEELPEPPVEVPLDALVYVMFTSGSTGRPKGVAVSHRAVANRLAWGQETFRLDAGDRHVLKTPFTFDVSVPELFWPLHSGAGLVIAADEGHRDPAYLADLVDTTRATTLHVVPSMLGAFLDVLDAGGRAGAGTAEGRGAGRGGARCASLRQVFASGEALPDALAARFRATLPGVELHNLYGPTEAAVEVSWHRCEPGRRVTIGRPVANTRLEVLDQHGRRQPVGVPGELCLGGVQLARGYVGRPGLTAERFVADPLVPGERLYRTGDLARWTGDGEVEFLGRLDQQVKLRGVRIELGDIEAALAEHPAVEAAVVRLWEPTPGDQQLVAHLVPSTPSPEKTPAAAAPDRAVGTVPAEADVSAAAVGTVPDAAQVRAFLADRLPSAMIPAHVLPLAGVPRTSSGKVDRSALPDPSRERSTADLVAPRTADEHALADVWRGLLGVDAVGVHDDFFHLGGHSLLAVRMTAEVRSHGIDVELRDVLAHPTIAGLLATRRPPATTGAATGATTGMAAASDPSGSRAGRVARGPAVRWVHDGPGVPVVCVHGGDGLTHAYRPVVAAMADRPVALVDWVGTGSDTVEDAARRHADVITADHPHDGYTVLGWSGGAAVTWALARELHGRGHRVELVLLDPVTEPVRRTAFDEDIAAAALVVDPATTPAEAAQALSTLVPAPAGAAVTEADVDAWREWVAARLSLMTANREHTMAPWPGALWLLVSEDVTGGGHQLMGGLSYEEYVGYWRAAAGAVEVVPLRGDHDSAMTGVAAVLREGATA